MRGEREALAWSVCRRELFLSRTREPAMGLDMRLLVTTVCGDFVDLTDVSVDTDETERRKIGDDLLQGRRQGRPISSA